MPVIQLKNPNEFADVMAGIWHKAEESNLFQDNTLFQRLLDKTPSLEVNLYQYWLDMDKNRYIEIKRALPALMGKSTSELVFKIPPEGKELTKTDILFKKTLRKYLRGEQISLREFGLLVEYAEMEVPAKYECRNKAVKYL